MALLNIATLATDVQRTLKKIEAPAGLELLCYKRNRGVAILKCSDGNLFLKEFGYKDQERTISSSALAKELKTIVKREFPRSRKVRLVKIDSPDELDRKRQKI